VTAHWTTVNISDQSGRVAVVTGANSGLGYHVAVALAVAGAQVVLACRNPGKAERAVASIRALAPAANVAFLPLDLADLDSVASFAAGFSSAYDRLDLLVNNAGLMAVDQSRTVDGFETQLGVNHLGHFALTSRLLPAMLWTPGARIASMSSMAHRSGQLVIDDLMFDRRGYSRWQAYSQSKLANLLFTAELQRRLGEAGAEAIAVAAHPGIARTGLGSQGHALSNRLMRIGPAPSTSSAASGALPLLRAATDPDVAGGQFYGPRWLVFGRPVLETASKRARDDSFARSLWRASVELTGLDPAFGR
jgi:NAD(P)-dependent dehydrogenase (short-subunit alcohol dehydrogenase family)